MNIFTRIAIVVLLGTINIVFAASTSWSPKFNRDFITGSAALTQANFTYTQAYSLAPVKPTTT